MALRRTRTDHQIRYGMKEERKQPFGSHMFKMLIMLFTIYFLPDSF